MFTSEFFPKRNNSIIFAISILILAAGTLALINYQKEETPVVDTEAEENARFAEINKQRQQEKLRQELEEAEIKRAAAAKIEQQGADRLAKEQEEKRLAKIAAEEKIKADRITLREKIAREVALSSFVGTKYKTLEGEGTTYHNVRVTKATPATVSVIHKNGARSFKYTQLSHDVQKACHYDPVACHTYLKAMQKSQAKPSQLQPTTPRPASIVSKESAPKSKNKIRPRGSITATVTSQRSGHSANYYRRNKHYDYHFKTVTVKAKANVPATLFNYNSAVGSVMPGKTRTFTIRSTHKGKYSLELRAKSGEILDHEAYNKKSGLSPSSL